MGDSYFYLSIFLYVLTFKLYRGISSIAAFSYWYYEKDNRPFSPQIKSLFSHNSGLKVPIRTLIKIEKQQQANCIFSLPEGIKMHRFIIRYC